MKRYNGIFISLIAAVLLMVSCKKEASPVRFSIEDCATISFNVSVQKSDETPMTTSYDPEDEKKVNSLDILVFMDEDGSLQNHVRMNPSTEVEIFIPRKHKVNYFVLANVPENAFEGVSDITGFNSKYSVLEENGMTNLVMGASGSSTFYENEETVELTLKHILSKVRVNKITPVFKSTIYRTSTIKFVSAYMINVCGATPYTMQPTDLGVWHNKLKLDTSLPDTLKNYLFIEKNIDITSAASLTDPFEFYFNPNVVSNSIDSEENPEWSPRSTRLVLEFNIDGKVKYFPVTLPKMQCNRQYTYEEIKLLGTGYSIPDIYIPDDRSYVEFKVTVEDFVNDDILVQFNEDINVN